MKTTLLAFTSLVALSLPACKDMGNNIQTDGKALSLQSGSTTGTIPVTGGAGSTTETRLEGPVTAVDVTAGTVTIRSIVVQTNGLTKIERNGIRVPLSAIRVGDRGQARIPAGTTVASKVESVG